MILFSLLGLFVSAMQKHDSIQPTCQFSVPIKIYPDIQHNLSSLSHYIVDPILSALLKDVSNDPLSIHDNLNILAAVKVFKDILCNANCTVTQDMTKCIRKFTDLEKELDKVGNKPIKQYQYLNNKFYTRTRKSYFESLVNQYMTFAKQVTRYNSLHQLRENLYLAMYYFAVHMVTHSLIRGYINTDMVYKLLQSIQVTNSKEYYLLRLIKQDFDEYIQPRFFDDIRYIYDADDILDAEGGAGMKMSELQLTSDSGHGKKMSEIFGKK